MHCWVWFRKYDSSSVKRGQCQGSSGVAGWPRLGREYAGQPALEQGSSMQGICPGAGVHAGGSAPGHRGAANVYPPFSLHHPCCSTPSPVGWAMTTIDYHNYLILNYHQWRSLSIVNRHNHWHCHDKLEIINSTKIFLLFTIIGKMPCDMSLPRSVQLITHCLLRFYYILVNTQK